MLRWIITFSMAEALGLNWTELKLLCDSDNLREILIIFQFYAIDKWKSKGSLNLIA